MISPPPNTDVLAGAVRAMRLVCGSLPHLAGLAHAVEIRKEPRVGTAGITASGRLLIAPEFWVRLQPAEQVFVLAHELLHLALDSHRRGEGQDALAVNFAHDCIINDMLATALDMPVPAGGLERPGARHESLERLLVEMASQGDGPSRRSWRASHGGIPVASPEALDSPLREALVEAMGLPAPQASPELGDGPAGDVIPVALERDWYPEPADEIQARATEIRDTAIKAAALASIEGSMEAYRHKGYGSGDTNNLVEAIREAYRPPWEVALQRAFDSVAPADRSWARPSRRGGLPDGMARAGRRREGWTLNIVLDTSGSMTDDLPRILGRIATFCEAAGVDGIRLLQCDTEVTSDERLYPEEVLSYEIRGYGGSDMSPAMERLAEEPEVELVLVLTDGYIDYPQQPPPYAVVWGVMPWEWETFVPPYGRVVPIDPDENQEPVSRGRRDPR